MSLINYTCNNCDYYNQRSTNFICGKCAEVNPISANINYFTYFNIKEFYAIVEDLDSIYQELILLYHPDNHVLKSEFSKLNSLKHTAYLNQAFDVLKDDIKRFAYYYFLQNKEEIIGDLVLKNSSIAMEFFDIYEQLDSTKDLKELNNLEQTLNQQQKELIVQAKVLDFKKQADAKKLYMRLNYFQKIKGQLKDKKRLMED